MKWGMEGDAVAEAGTREKSGAGAHANDAADAA